MNRAEQAFLALSAVGVFTVDDRGRVWRHRRLIAGSQHGTPPHWRPTRKKLAARSKSDGYPTVMFSDGETRHKVFSHRVVWMLSSQQDIPAGMQVNHKNGIRGDSRPANLELVTVAENVRHSFKVLGRKLRNQSGEKNGSAKVTAADVVEIRALAGRMSQSQIARRFGITQSAVSAIILRKSWAHIA